MGSGASPTPSLKKKSWQQNKAGLKLNHSNCKSRSGQKNVVSSTALEPRLWIRRREPEPTQRVGETPDISQPTQPYPGLLLMGHLHHLAAVDPRTHCCRISTTTQKRVQRLHCAAVALFQNKFSDLF